MVNELFRGRPSHGRVRRLPGLVAVTILLVLAPTANAGAIVDACDPAPAGFNVIKGTTGNDILVGTSGRDVICGRGGADVIRGGGGNDRLLRWLRERSAHRRRGRQRHRGRWHRR